MSKLIAAMPLFVVALFFGVLVGVPAFVAWRQARQDRRRIMAEGITGQAVITKIGPQSRDDQSSLYFSFQPSIADPPIEVSQRTSRAAIDKLGLVIGSTVQVHYLPKWPKFGFVDALVLPERILANNSANTVPVADISGPASLFYVSYAPANNLRWAGNGDVVIADHGIRFTAQRRRPFWFPKAVQSDFALNTIVNVEQVDATVRLEILQAESRVHKLQFRTVNSTAAESIAGLPYPSTHMPSDDLRRTAVLSPVRPQLGCGSLTGSCPRGPFRTACGCRCSRRGRR